MAGHKTQDVRFFNVEGLEQYDIDREDRIHFFPCFYEGVMNSMLYCSKFRECVPDDFCQGKCKEYEPNVVRKCGSVEKVAENENHIQ